MFDIRIVIKSKKSNFQSTIKYLSDQEDIIKHFYCNKKNSISGMINDLPNNSNNYNIIEHEIVAVSDFNLFSSNKSSLSLTDEYKIFQHLPIKRKNIMLILCSPSSLNIDNPIADFISNLSEEDVKGINNIIVLKHTLSSPNILDKNLNSENINLYSNCTNSTINRFIIIFNSLNEADNFYFNYSNKSFFNQFEKLYCCFIDKIYLEEVSEKELKQQNFLESELFDEQLTYNYQFVIDDKYQIPSCPLCLEEMDEQVTKINAQSFSFQIESWKIFRENCSLCRKRKILKEISDKKNEIEEYIKCYDVKCEICDFQKNQKIWECMICGFKGCGRYDKGHSVEHFQNSYHRFSMLISIPSENSNEISTGIWDYVDDTFVHKINNLDSKFLSVQESIRVPNANVINERIDIIISDYNVILEEQLDKQRKYYERELSKMQNSSIYDKKQIEKLLEENKELKAKKEQLSTLIKEYKKKETTLSKKISNESENNDLTRNIIKGIQTEISNISDYNKNRIISKEEKELIEKINKKKEFKQKLEEELNKLYLELN